MNIHPLIVHFPIALLIVYACLELLQIKKILAWEPWFYIKFFFIFFGFLGAAAAYITGDWAAGVYAGARAIVRLHETYAKATVIIFGVLCVHYGVGLLRRMPLGIFSLPAYPRLEQLLVSLDKMYNRFVLVVLALAGLLCVSITGALGGSLVYGPNSDFFIRFVYFILAVQ